MPNILDANGLQVKTRAELVAELTAAYEAIYGADIDLSSNTPDGQMLNIYVQAYLDIQDLLVQVFNSFSPDFAIGRVLDQRVAINGIQRQAGTYTITPVTLTNTASVNLYGLDEADESGVRADGNEVYTVVDNAGTRWLLQETQLGLAPGFHVLGFRAEEPGQTLTIPNTITTPVTIVLGVESVNNPSTYTTLGQNEETDAELRLRRQRSVSLASQGYERALQAALQNITGVTFARVYENTTGVTDSDGIPPHSIWVVVAGTGAAADIAQAIYSKRNAGAGMKGDQEYTIIQANGLPFLVKWDNVEYQNVFIFITAQSIDGLIPPAVAAIRSGLVENYIPDIDEELDINGLACAVQAIDPNALVSSAGFSDGKEQELTLSGVAASGTFKLNYNGDLTAAINWNDSVETIQSKIQAITGLSGVTVTGSIASQSLVVDLSSVESVAALLYAVDNSLQTSAPADIVVTNVPTKSLVLSAPKQLQFTLAEENIIITAMLLNRSAAQVAPSGNATFSAVGGYGPYTYSITVNNSVGATIDAATGVYTAGSFSGVDTIQAVDALGNVANATIQVA